MGKVDGMGAGVSGDVLFVAWTRKMDGEGRLGRGRGKGEEKRRGDVVLRYPDGLSGW